VLARSSVNWNRGFTGYIADGETGLLHARARQYSSLLGRFCSRDPLGYIDGDNFYRAYFVPNDIDPSGMSSSSYPATCPADPPRNDNCQPDACVLSRQSDDYWHPQALERLGSHCNTDCHCAVLSKSGPRTQLPHLPRTLEQRAACIRNDGSNVPAGWFDGPIPPGHGVLPAPPAPTPPHVPGDLDLPGAPPVPPPEAPGPGPEVY